MEYKVQRISIVYELSLLLDSPTTTACPWSLTKAQLLSALCLLYEQKAIPATVYAYSRGELAKEIMQTLFDRNLISGMRKDDDYGEGYLVTAVLVALRDEIGSILRGRISE